MDLVLKTTVTCNTCNHQFPATMPEDSCQQAIDCPACNYRLVREAPHCCVFCTHAEHKCPPEQVSA
ncbi:MAG: GDCCVxC domain-containing (seleno)protein [Thermoplasmatota archaeon]